MSAKISQPPVIGMKISASFKFSKHEEEVARHGFLWLIDVVSYEIANLSRAVIKSWP